MKWSFKLFTAFGIGVYVHVTFLLVIPLFILPAGVGSNGETTATGLLIATAFTLSIFACVLLHEFGHALTAKRYRIRTRDITLLPIGGLARLERIPTDPVQEFFIAIAGPAVNLAIAGLLFPVTLVIPPAEGDVTTFMGRGFLQTLLWINLWLALFNCIPAFPMDGGRILRALLATRIDYLRATRIAVGVGQALAFAFGLFGFMTGGYSLILIAFFIYMGASQEGFMVQYRYSFQGLPTSLAMITRFRTLKEDERLEQAVQYLLQGSQVDFPVLRDHEVLGILTRSALIDSLGKQGPQALIHSTTIRPVPLIEDDLPLDRAYETMQAESVSCLPVMHRGELVGLLTMENLAEFAMVSQALHRRDGQDGRNGGRAPV